MCSLVLLVFWDPVGVVYASAANGRLEPQLSCCSMCMFRAVIIRPVKVLKMPLRSQVKLSIDCPAATWVPTCMYYM